MCILLIPYYVQRFVSLATVHIAFTAAIVHLADMKLEEPSYQQQATRGFTTCVDALEEMKYTWSAWSVKALRAIRNIQEEWSTAQFPGTCKEAQLF